MKWDTGLPETTCGYGSTMECTEHLRRWLPLIMAGLGVRSLLDAPCGDFNWMASFPELEDVIGVDNDPDHIARARDRAPHVRFEQLDIVHDELPKVDAVLSRDFLQHLSNEDVRLALANFRRTGARWLLATTFRPGTTADIEPATRPFRRLDLEPLMGEPLVSVADPPGMGRTLSVWALT